MNELFSVYGITVFICFCFWFYFDQLSNIIFKYKTYQANQINKPLQDVLSTDQTLMSHLISKFVFYVSGVIVLLSIQIELMIAAFFAFLIGTVLAAKSQVLEQVLLESKVEHKPLEDRVLTYCTVSNVSFIIFASMFIFI